MIFNAKEFLNDYQIRWTDNGPNTHAGWVNINCPFCGDRSFHGGFSLTMPAYNCWRCRQHKVVDVIVNLLSVDHLQARYIFQKYASVEPDQVHYDNVKKGKGTLSLPSGCGELNERHIKYLVNRGFDHEKITKEWSLYGTGHIGSYKQRIIAPIYLNYKMVSYQGRDITGNSHAKYKACAKADELYHHQHMLYGIDNIKNHRAIIVEGIADVWKLGYGAIATFGIDFTYPQVLMLAENLNRMVVLFDKGETAQKKAHELCAAAQALSHNEMDVELATLTSVDDPGELSHQEAAYIKRQLLT